MATIPKQRIEPSRTISGNSPHTLVLPLGATQTFKAGAPVYLSGGYVVVCTTSSDLVNSNILGFALEDATSGSAGAYNIRVALAEEDTIFVGNVGDASTQTTAHTLRGTAAGVYDVSAGSYNGLWTIDTTGITGSTNRVMIVDLYPGDTVGDATGRVLFRVLQQWYQLARTS